MTTDNNLVNLFIGVWAESIAGRMNTDHQSIRESREAAVKRYEQEAPITRESEKVTTILEIGAGYEATSLVAPYSGPRPFLGYRPVDDPDARLFLVVTVECALKGLAEWHQALAEHTWVMRRGDKCFNYGPKPGLPNPVPRLGNAKVDWCKHSRARIIRPAIQRAIESRDPETIVESTLMDIGMLSA